MGLAGELAAHGVIAGLLDGAAVDAGVGAGEVDVLEDAGGVGGGGGRVATAGDAVFGDHDELAGFDVALVLGMKKSKAQVSDAKTKVSGCTVFAGDAAHGEGPEAVGSRAAKMRLRVIMTMEKAPSTSERASAMQSTRVLQGEWAMSWMMISESEVVWKTAPSRSRRARDWPRLTRLPLWAMARRPLVDSTLMGWALSRAESPVVE